MIVDCRWRVQGFLFLFLLAGGAVFSAEIETPEGVIVQNEWRVGISVLGTQTEDSVLLSAASLISRLIKDELKGIEYHSLTDTEKKLLRKKALEKKEIELYAHLSSLYSSRDDYLFNPNADSSSLKKLNGQINDVFLSLSYWRDVPLSSIPIPEKLQVIYPVPPDGAELWNVESYSSDAFRLEAGLDVLINGSIVKVGEYYGIRISLLSPSGEDVLWEGAGDENDLEKISSEATAAARSLILGRPWASLTIQTEPPESVIKVNGEIVGVGLWSDTDMEPGVVILEVSAPGFLPKIVNEMLVPGDIREIDISLVETEQPQVLILSTPPGASLRLGSIWLGRAPLSLNQPDRVMSLTVAKEGFITRTVPLYPEAERLTVPLDYVLIDPVEELAASRKKLYSSIAWFSFSLAPTIILLGVSQNYANMNFNSSNPEDYESSYNAYRLSYGLMWGSVAINVGLLTNVFFKLSRYLKAAEGLSD